MEGLKAWALVIVAAVPAAYSDPPPLAVDEGALAPEGYVFDLPGGEGRIEIVGREVTLTGQSVFVEYYPGRPVRAGGAFKADRNRDLEINALASGGVLRLEDGEGNTCAPYHVHLAHAQSYPGGVVLEFHYRGALEGELTGVVNWGEEGVSARVALGPADRNYYRRATVKEETGIRLRTGPWVKDAVVKILPAGTEFYVKWFRRWSYVGEGGEYKFVYYEARWSEKEGWVAWKYAGSDETFFEIGDFAAR